MSQYVFTMTSRMVAITAICLLLLCALLFVMGMEIGKLMGTTAVANAAPAPVQAQPLQPAPNPPASAPASAAAPSTSTP